AGVAGVVGEPPQVVAGRRRGHLERGDDEGAEEARDAVDAEVEADADGPHGGRHLRVEELLHPHHREHVGDAQQHVLRQQPEDAQAPPAGAGGGHAEPPGLDERGDDHGDAGEDHADAHPLEHRDAVGAPRDGVDQRDDHPVVHGHEQDDGDGDGALEHGRRDHEDADPVVHQHALLREERHRLLEDEREHEQDRPDWQEAEYDPGHAGSRSPIDLGLLFIGLFSLQWLLLQPADADLPTSENRLEDLVEDGVRRRRRRPSGVLGLRLGLRLPVQRGAAEEGGDRERHDAGGDGEAEHPAQVVLDVGHGGVAQQAAAAQAEVPPLEELALHLALLLRRHGRARARLRRLRVAVVVPDAELIGPEGLQRRLVSALPDGHQVERDVQRGARHPCPQQRPAGERRHSLTEQQQHQTIN
ncbi:hypothetical protein U9M48_029126, partial [Paspalum notatum var. saurae]